MLNKFLKGLVTILASILVILLIIAVGTSNRADEKIVVATNTASPENSYTNTIEKAKEITMHQKIAVENDANQTAEDDITYMHNQLVISPDYRNISAAIKGVPAIFFKAQADSSTFYDQATIEMLDIYMDDFTSLAIAYKNVQALTTHPKALEYEAISHHVGNKLEQLASAFKTAFDEQNNSALELSTEISQELTQSLNKLTELRNDN